MTCRWFKAVIMTLTVAVALAMTADVDAARRKKSRPRDINKVRKEQTATTKAIKETNRKINFNTKETRRQLNKYNSLAREIESKRKDIAALQLKTDMIAGEIKVKQDSIELLSAQLQKLRDGYISVLRSMQEAPSSMSRLAFVFASDSFSEAWQRFRYLEQFRDWQKVKNAELKASAEQLEKKKAELQQLHQQQTRMLGDVKVARLELQTTQDQTNRIIDDLKKERGALTAVLKENEAKAKRLDAELDRLIAEEQKKQEKADRQNSSGKNAKSGGTKKPGANDGKATAKVMTGNADEERRLNGSFESNRGRLLFPVSGRYSIVRGFGIQKHPELTHVETNNNGIDVEVSPGTRVRSIFDGTVTAIFVQPGYNTIVMIRHGSYLSVYAGLQNITVAKGDKVKANRTIGSVSPDVENDNKAILHFELRKEREKLNPLDWVR